MAISVVFLQKNSTSAQDLRLINSSVIGDEGIVTGLAVTANGTRTLTVGPGSAFVPTTIAGESGWYHVQNISASTYTVPTGVTGTRFLLLRVVGTGGVSFTDAAAASGTTITLASFNATSTGGISTGDLNTSVAETARMSYSLVPQSIRTLSTARPTQDLTAGLRIFEMDTTLTRQYTTGGDWEYLAGDITAGYVMSKVLTQDHVQASRWKITSANAVLRAGVVQGLIQFEFRPSQMIVPGNGNIANEVVCTIKDPYRPPMATRAAPIATGRLITGSVSAAGQVSITSMASGDNVLKGEGFSLGWTCPVRSI